MSQLLSDIGDDVYQQYRSLTRPPPDFDPPAGFAINVRGGLGVRGGGGFGGSRGDFWGAGGWILAAERGGGFGEGEDLWRVGGDFGVQGGSWGAPPALMSPPGPHRPRFSVLTEPPRRRRPRGPPREKVAAFPPSVPSVSPSDVPSLSLNPKTSPVGPLPVPRALQHPFCVPKAFNVPSVSPKLFASPLCPLAPRVPSRSLSPSVSPSPTPWCPLTSLSCPQVPQCLLSVPKPSQCPLHVPEPPDVPLSLLMTPASPHVPTVSPAGGSPGEGRKEKDGDRGDERPRAKATRPLLPTSSILRLLAELVRSYVGIASLIANYSYSVGQSELIKEVTTTLGTLGDMGGTKGRPPRGHRGGIFGEL